MYIQHRRETTLDFIGLVIISFAQTQPITTLLFLFVYVCAFLSFFLFCQVACKLLTEILYASSNLLLFFILFLPLFPCSSSLHSLQNENNIFLLTFTQTSHLKFYYYFKIIILFYLNIKRAYFVRKIFIPKICIQILILIYTNKLQNKNSEKKLFSIYSLSIYLSPFFYPVQYNKQFH